MFSILAVKARHKPNLRLARLHINESCVQFNHKKIGLINVVISQVQKSRNH